MNGWTDGSMDGGKGGLGWRGEGKEDGDGQIDRTCA